MDFILYVLKRILAVAFLAGVSLAILYHGTPWIIAFVLVLLTKPGRRRAIKPSLA